MADKCRKCGNENINYAVDSDGYYCSNCGYEYKGSKTKKTNADRIREMSDEELADAMYKANNLGEMIPFCKNSNRCTDILDRGEVIPDSMCKQCLMEWLQSEVEET